MQRCLLGIRFVSVCNLWEQRKQKTNWEVRLDMKWCRQERCSRQVVSCGKRGSHVRSDKITLMAFDGHVTRKRVRPEKLRKGN